MPSRILTNDHLESFAEWLNLEEKSSATCEKYIRDIQRFLKFTADEAVSKEVVARWKNDLIAQGYAVRSINSMLASLNSLLVFLEWGGLQSKKYTPPASDLQSGGEGTVQSGVSAAASGQ